MTLMNTIMQQPPTIFNRSLMRTRRQRAASSFQRADFLKSVMVERIVERLHETMRNYSLALDIGCHTGELGRALQNTTKLGRLIACDLSEAMLMKTSGLRVVMDEEYIPFAPASVDAVLSAMSLHWVNDVPGALLQLQRCLKPDGLFLVSLLGGNTLAELREAVLQAELEHGVHPRVSPFLDVRDAGGLLQRAGFALPVVDSETFVVTYDNAFALMKDLRAMGETNGLMQQTPFFTSRTAMMHIAETYQHVFADSEGRIPATFEIITLTAWKPHGSQPKPLARGSGSHALGNALKE